MKNKTMQTSTWLSVISYWKCLGLVGSHLPHIVFNFATKLPWKLSLSHSWLFVMLISVVPVSLFSIVTIVQSPWYTPLMRLFGYFFQDTLFLVLNLWQGLLGEYKKKVETLIDDMIKWLWLIVITANIRVYGISCSAMMYIQFYNGLATDYPCH